ncbi:MAG: choice-of-anchor I family protein [Pseudomonadota bacterium]
MKTRFPSRGARLLAALGLSALLAVACGGGDEAPSPAPSTPAATVAGVAAVGAPLVGAQVSFQCVAGSPAATTTAANGSFTVPSAGVTFPCAVKVTGGNVATAGGAANTQAYYSVVLASGTANATPLSTLLVAILGGGDPAAWFDRAQATPSSLSGVTSAAVSTALGSLRTLLAGMPTPLTLPAGFDPVTTAFSAVTTDSTDKLLEQFKTTLATGGASFTDVVDQAVAGLPLVERTPLGMTMEKIGGFTHRGGLSAAEITAYDPLSKRLFVINGALDENQNPLGTADVLSLANPAAPVQVGTVTMASISASLCSDTPNCSANSVAVHNGIVALAIQRGTKTLPGFVAFLRATDLTVVGTATAGALPDMLTFSPDGKYLLVANEGEPNSYGQGNSVDPEGSVTIIELAGLKPDATSIQKTVTQVGFTSFNSQIDTLRAAGVRIYGPGATVAQDLEPEYITVSADSKKAYVTLQENNAIAVIDIATKTVLSIKPLGYKDHSIAGNGMDVSNEDGSTNTNSGTSTIKITTVPVKGLYLPDAIASFTVGTATYLITANEGDAREYTGVVSLDNGREDPRVRTHCPNGLDPAVFTDATNLRFDSNLGRLRVTAYPNGNNTGKNEAGQCTELWSLGARSFSIWSADVVQVFDSGDQFEQKTAALHPTLTFNASNDNNDFDDRSSAKGPEPEGVTVGRIGTKTFAFIGLERVGGVMVYDVTNPAAPVYVTYLNTRTGATGDRGPEGVTFIKASKSPNGKPLLVVGNETSGTTAIFQLNLTY